MSQSRPLPSVGVRELRQDASAILRRVKDGETIEITEHGKPIAHIGPIEPSRVETWIARKLITPAKSPGTLSSLKPIKSEIGSSIKEALDYTRADKI
jgi:prevent-host-death family protein